MIIELSVDMAELIVPHYDWEFLYANPNIKTILIKDQENPDKMLWAAIRNEE